jgi:N-acetylmuramoyl-L-alanine amidase
VAPGSSATKPRDAGGTSGVVTGEPESLVNLQVAMKLRDVLAARGIKVVMVRTTQAQRRSSIERARIANSAGADLFVRLHCDGSGDRAKHGISVLVPARASWTQPIYARSREAGKLALASAVQATGAQDLGLVERSDLAGFNWSKVPSLLVEMGFMSNAAEDRRLVSDSYQKALARGIGEGVSAYLEAQ